MIVTHGPVLTARCNRRIFISDGCEVSLVRTTDETA
jgi:predicted ABC-type transport system involved in lysophospholipase L1 biosynthesis ATPase subunit